MAWYVPTRRQATYWTNDVYVHWRIYVSLGLSELMMDAGDAYLPPEPAITMTS